MRTKITQDNKKLLNDCIIDLMSDRYQTLVLDQLEEYICINKAGIYEFNKILEKHGVSITNAHGFREYWIENTLTNNNTR